MSPLPTRSTESRLAIPTAILLIAALLMGGCQTSQLAADSPARVEPASIPEGMSAEEAATLASLRQVDDYPLYTMTYQADYLDQVSGAGFAPENPGRADWACSLFAAFGDPDEMLFGRNFDWDFSPGLLLLADPVDGYASLSMVDLYYLGFGDERAYGLTDLPLEELAGLLDAPFMPFDGMNEAGLAVGMAAVPEGGMPPDPAKETADSVLVIRKVLDQAATIAEAAEIIQSYNIDWGSGPSLHYLVADASGHSALIEFSGGESHIIGNQGPWQAATNFLASEVRGDPTARCWRYGMISEYLEQSGGKTSPGEAMELLEDVAQENTQWSVVYQISTGEVRIAMGRNYTEIHQLKLSPGY